jgi:hypothetical protein
VAKYGADPEIHFFIYHPDFSGLIGSKTLLVTQNATIKENG